MSTFTLEQFRRIVADAPAVAKSATGSALKSEGWRIREVIKASVLGGGHPTAPFPALNPHTAAFNRARKAARRGKRMKRERGGIKTTGMRLAMELSLAKPLKKLASGARYQYFSESQTVTIGFISARVMFLMKKAAEGFRTAITPKMRRMAFAIGFPLRGGTTRFSAPARPVVPPVFRAERERMTENVRDKVAAQVIGHVIGRRR